MTPRGPYGPHRKPRKLRALDERFWEKVNKDGPGGCWLWKASLNRYGYGNFSVNLERDKSFSFKAHRWAYERLVGQIPEGLTIDHLCRVRHCVNPAHMETVSAGENVLRGLGACALNARKTHCKRGHEFTEENTIPYPNNGRACRTCTREAQKRYKQSKVAA